MVRYVRFYTRWRRRENDQFSTLRCTKTGSTQPKLSTACFVVQSCLADADFVVFSNYCLIGTRQKGVFYFLAHPKGFEPPFSRIGICCVIQLRHGWILSSIFIRIFIFNYTETSSHISYSYSCSFCNSSSLFVSSISFS